MAVYQSVGSHVHTLALTDGFCELFGYADLAEAYRLMDQGICYNTHPDDVGRIYEAVRRFSAGSGRYEVIFRARKHHEQSYRIIHGLGRHVYTHSGVRLAYVWYTDEGEYTGNRDTQASALNRAFNNALHEESILKANYYDNLTGLPNLPHFFELVENSQIAKAGEEMITALLYLDLEGMKYYNSKHGFSEGDKLLQGLAKLLSKTFGIENCCHIGADRYAVYAKEAGLDEILARLFTEAKALNEGKSLPLRVGIYSSSIEEVPVSTAYDRAKIACDALSQSSTSRYNYYSQKLLNELKRRLYIQSSIDRAISEKWIKVYYQPIVRAINGRACDVEALARWIDPEEGFLSPAEFIPYLEDAGLIYKLDLYVLEQVLIKMNRVTSDGLQVVPHSINLSRSDFDACDIVEEIRKRVDAAGISHAIISIEITESIIGKDFDFMKTQVERFQKLGFPVWMDDFGSGYSSLDVLQSIRFDLLKFDMGFMRRLHEGESGKIILTELVKMATSLGMDTICEGVETAEQVHFLQEIGCSKLQGYYFSKPVSYQEILERKEKGSPLLPENPEESSYYETIGRVNLYDLGVITRGHDNELQNAFDTLPMGILEIRADSARYVRTSPSYRDFMKRFFQMDVFREDPDFSQPISPHGIMFLNHLRQCCETGNSAFFDERMSDGSKVHSFVRRISVNPVTGSVALAIAVLSVSDPDQDETYTDIAMALAADYYSIYVVDLNTDAFIEYSSRANGQDLPAVQRGEKFFEKARRDTLTRIYEEDRASFLALFTKENVLKDLDSQGVFTALYRLIDTGTPMYVNMKITRLHGGNRIILGVSIVEAQMRQKEEIKKAREQSVLFSRIAALSGKFYALYIIDPETGKYSEYNVTSGYGSLGFDKDGENFFVKGRSDGEQMVFKDDLSLFRAQFTQENILRAVREKGLFQIQYRLVINGEPKPILLKAAMVRENEAQKLIVGVNIADV